MKTAYEILGIPPDQEDDAIKQAYLIKVKQYPPEQASEQFQKIRSAYEAIKDKKSRINYELFYQPEANFDKLLARAFENGPATAIDGDSLIKLLRSGIEESL